MFVSELKDARMVYALSVLLTFTYRGHATLTGGPVYGATISSPW